MVGFFKKYPALIIFIGVGVLLTVVFVFYEVMYNRQNRKQQKAYEELNKSSWIVELSHEEKEEEIDPSEQAKAENAKKMEEFLAKDDNASEYHDYVYGHPNFESYLELNKDVIGYIRIPDTKIDYPVLWNETEDNYYLKRNIDGSTGYPGCIYVQNINANDFSDSVTILYGHNMMDGTMFGELGKLYRRKDFREEHPYIFIYTMNAVCVYELVETSTYSDDHLFAPYFEKDGDDNFYFTELPENAQMDVFKRIKEYGDKGAYIAEETNISEEDKLIILSTCYGDRRRFVVAGRLLFYREY